MKKKKIYQNLRIISVVTLFTFGLITIITFASLFFGSSPTKVKLLTISVIISAISYFAIGQLSQWIGDADD